MSIGILPRRTCVWIDDSSVDECYECHTEFSWYIRRHHCRGCGRIFCYNCSRFQIESNYLSGYNLADPEQYLSSCLNAQTSFTRYRSCEKCTKIFQKIKDLSGVVKVFELLDLEITEYKILGQVCRLWRDASHLLLSRFREIQYNLPKHIHTLFEKRILKTNFHLILGHNRLICQFIKSTDWFGLDDDELYYYLHLLKSEQQVCPCWTLMCFLDCESRLTDSEVIDILLHIRHPLIRQHVVSYLTNNIELLECYIPILTYSIRLDEKNDVSPIRDHLIYLSIMSTNIRYKLYWELLVQMEEPHYNHLYRTTMQTLLDATTEHHGQNETNNLNASMKLVNVFSQLSMESHKFGQITSTEGSSLDQIVENKLTTNQIYGRPIRLPIRPELVMEKIDSSKIKVMKSATQPVYIPFKVMDLNKRYAVIYKSEDVRKDYVISNIIKVMDYLLKMMDMDMNVVTYNVLPTGLNNGLIEIVPDSSTIYYIKEKTSYSIQNYILENNKDLTVEDVRNRFIKSTAAYCVMTYLLGIGDRHLDNIMVTSDGCLFHIDYSFVMGLDPKLMAPKMRITTEMVDALGGRDSKYYKQFEELCSKCYNAMRKHCNLFTNMLFLLTRIDDTQFTYEQLEMEIKKRFLPGEYQSQAKIQLIKTINTTHTSSTLMDLVHYHYKENLSWGGLSSWIPSVSTVQNASSTVLNYINPWSSTEIGDNPETSDSSENSI